MPLISGCSQKEVLLSNLVVRDSMMYEVNSDSPFSGLGVEKSPNEQYRKKISFRNGKKDGESIEYYQNGQIKTRIEYTNGVEDGISEFYFENGQLEKKAEYKDGELNGVYEKYYENGNPMAKAQYQMGTQNGEYIEYFSNGQIAESTMYVNGKIDGKYVAYFENGNKNLEYITSGNGYEGDYIKYNEDGSVQHHVYYNTDNTKINKGTWKKHRNSDFQVVDKPDAYYSTVSFDEKGKPSSDVIFYYTKTNQIYSQGHFSSVEPDIRDGEFTWYYYDGSIKQKGKYVDNLANGIFESYYQDLNYSGKSKVHERIEYKNGKLDGVYEKYNGRRPDITMVPYKVANLGGDGRWWKIEGQCVDGKYNGLFKIWYRYRDDLERRTFPAKAYMKHIWSNGTLQYGGRNERKGINEYYDMNGNLLTEGPYGYARRTGSY